MSNGTLTVTFDPTDDTVVCESSHGDYFWFEVEHTLTLIRLLTMAYEDWQRKEQR